MPIPAKLPKPKQILYAERALAVWILWTCLFGIFETKGQIPDLQNALAELEDLLGQLGYALTISPGQILLYAILGYGGLALITVWFLWKIGERKKWARSSFLGGFVAQILWKGYSPPHGFIEVLSAIPDLGLQAYALYLLYGKATTQWFKA